MTSKSHIFGKTDAFPTTSLKCEINHIVQHKI